MPVWQAFLLGVVQGLTEFLPVSSDGHLALAYQAIETRPNLAYEVFLHGATLLALLVYFRTDLLALLRSLGPKGAGTPERRVALLIVVATFVSGVVALAVSPYVEPASGSLLWTGIGFLVTAAALTLGEALARNKDPKLAEGEGDSLAPAAALGLPKAVGVALAQGAAAMPGVSRSGLTISAGMLSGLDREQAARFSFLLGIPIIALAAAKEGLDVIGGAAHLPPALPSAVGFLAALVSGYLAVAWLLGLLKRRSLIGFAVYTAVMGAASIILHFVV